MPSCRSFLFLVVVGFVNSFLCSSFSYNVVSKNGNTFVSRERSRRLMTGDEYDSRMPLSKTVASLCLVFTTFLLVSAPVPPAFASVQSLRTEEEVQGISAVTESDLGKSVRQSIISGAQLADRIDLKWERFSDSLRDEKKCDPRTNRRMFDNGTRKDGTKVGNPVLGALCTPEPLQPLDSRVATMISDLAEDSMKDTLGISDRSELRRKQEQVKDKVGAAFTRAIATDSTIDTEQEAKQYEYNRDLYIHMRAYGELIPNREKARTMERDWGNKILAKLGPNANRKDFNSPFPKPDPTDDQPYNEEALLDALGGVSVALSKLLDAGLIGRWEISIPEDDYWNVVTIAVDDDISIGGQILARERNQPLSGSAVVALIRSAMEDKAKIPYKLDTFFIDPTTTQQELYNPTQLLVSLSDLGQ